MEEKKLVQYEKKFMDSKMIKNQLKERKFFFLGNWTNEMKFIAEIKNFLLMCGKFLFILQLKFISTFLSIPF
mgnify:CR=1 FL=1